LIPYYFYVCSYHRSLHSFPTRRSSDLRRVTTALRLRQPRCLVVPLSADHVARFWKSFRTFRDLAIVALMLLDGLRSCEVLQLQRSEEHTSELQSLRHLVCRLLLEKKNR